MALQATFVADFSSFQDAVAKAEVSLKSFESGASKVESSLTRMTNSLSGTKLIQDATVMAEAVERVGGVSKLTEAELGRVGKTAAEAAAKLTALGQDVPPGIQRIADAARDAGEKHQTWTERVKENAAGYVAGMVSFNAFVAAGQKIVTVLKESVAQAAEAETAQRRLSVAMENQGSAAPALIRKYDELAESTQKVSTFSAAAVKELEVMLIQVGDVLPSQMATAVKATTDLASAMGLDLESAATLMAKAAEGNVGALKKMGVELDDARVKGEGLEYIAGQIEKRFGGQAAAELDTYAGKVKAMGNSWADTEEALGKMILRTGALQGAISVGNKQMDFYTAAIDGNVKGMALAAAGAIQYVTGSETLKTAIDHLTNSQVSNTTETEAAAQAADALILKRREEEAATLASAKAEREAASARAQHAASVKNLVDQWTGADLAAKVKLYAEAMQLAGGAERVTAFEMAGLVKQIDEFRKQGDALNPELINLWASQTNFNAVVDTSGQSLKRVIDATKLYGDGLVKIPPAAKSAEEAIAQVTTKTDDYVKSTERAIQTTAQFDATWTVLTGHLSRDKFNSAANDLTINDINTNAGFAGAFSPTDLSRFFQPRANGGPVDAGTPYLVGERGPELFVPSSSGSIRANGAGGGAGITINNYITQPLGTPEQIYRVVEEALIAVQTAQGVRFS